eukprot:11901244-Ditylum_brightwellii.AAC.1
MIDPATDWFEIKETTTRSSNVIANIVEQMWLTKYPWPQKDEYGIRRKPITTTNPQANSIVERSHQTIGNLLCTFEPGSANLDPKDPWSGILSTIMFALWSTIHTTHKATPMQLVFGKGAMLNITHVANWQFIQECQKNLIKKITSKKM